MKQALLLIAILIVVRATAQPLLPINTYLNNKQVSATAKEYYHGKFKASDDDRTFSIFDSLWTRNNATRPFYIFLTSRILEHADGALSEMAGSYCKGYIEQHPDQLVTYLKSLNKTRREKEEDEWAMAISGEFAIDCDGNVLTCINKSHKIALAKVSKQNKEILNELYVLIRHYASQ